VKRPIFRLITLGAIVAVFVGGLAVAKFALNTYYTQLIASICLRDLSTYNPDFTSLPNGQVKVTISGETDHLQISQNEMVIFMGLPENYIVELKNCILTPDAVEVIRGNSQRLRNMRMVNCEFPTD
jgi:hypothetical protein